MKVIAFNGSPRENGNTYESLNIVLNEIKKNGIETEMIQIGGKKLFGCLACRKCAQTKDLKCIRKDDNMNELIQKMIDADGIIIGSPTYFSNVSTEVKALIDRCGVVIRANGGVLKGKVGTAVVTGRRSGMNFVYSAINYFFGINEMVIASSNYWNMTLSNTPGDIFKDEEGIKVFEKLGNNFSDTVKKLNQ
jgi:multimeric flavodoxin WrbA